MEKIWFLLSKEAQEKLKAQMPKGWRPPRELPIKNQLNGKMEDLEEIDRIIRQPPNYNKGGGRVRG